MLGRACRLKNIAVCNHTLKEMGTRCRSTVPLADNWRTTDKIVPSNFGGMCVAHVKKRDDQWWGRGAVACRTDRTSNHAIREVRRGGTSPVLFDGSEELWQEDFTLLNTDCHMHTRFCAPPKQQQKILNTNVGRGKHRCCSAKAMRVLAAGKCCNTSLV